MAPSTLLHLNRMQYAVSRILMSALRRTGVTSLEVAAHLLPLALSRLSLLNTYVTRTLSILTTRRGISYSTQFSLALSPP